MSEESVTVRPAGKRGDEELFEVTVGEGGKPTSHVVIVKAADLARLAPGIHGAGLVAWAFGFLLARESKESILREFDLMVIAEYFPEFEAEAKRAFGGG